MNIIEETSKYMAPLIGKRIVKIGRAADMLWMHFGVLKSYIDYKGREIEKGQFAIHVQCPWRILYESDVILGKADMELYGEIEAASAHAVTGLSQFDELKDNVLEEYLSAPVELISISQTGTLVIQLTNGCTFETFPDSVCHQEFWRFINSEDGRHTVVFDITD